MRKHDRNREPSQRQLRVGEEMRHALAHMFERHILHHPALAARTVTVSEVRVSPDLKNATAFIMPLAGAQIEEVLEALDRSAGFLRRELAKAVPLRYAPNLSFAVDNSFAHASRIQALLHRPEVERDLSTNSEKDENGA
jgi:ribosome-binding factor A